MFATMDATETNESRLQQGGLVLDHLSGDLIQKLNQLSAADVQVLIDLKRRFAGDLALDPTMYWGSSEF